MEHALQLALDKAGSQVRLAEICGVSQPTVWGWLKTKKPRLPAEYVLKVEAALGVSRHELRPDIYPAQDAAA
ncbi:MAG: cytoplasmic chaperone TorD [Nocardioides sp.]|jgi:DNA-binding transcriptional regulator YdaS (Cro superfamily)|nr:cytoplasmic chaperone TorD [Nocardioides sp.]